MRTADNIEEQNARASTQRTRKKGIGTGNHPNSRAQLRPKPWPKGLSGNPGGKPGYDVAAKIARTVLEENQDAIYDGLAKRAIEGNAYTFKELAERGYGKLVEKHEHSADDLLLAALALGRKRIASDDTSR